jgi:hypothetical protein
VKKKRTTRQPATTTRTTRKGGSTRSPRSRAAAANAANGAARPARFYSPARRKGVARANDVRVPATLRPIVIRGDKVTAFTRLIAETLPLAGYTHILADCPGKRRPDTIRGIRADHRPNLVCQGGYRYVLIDVVLPGEMNFPDIASRWQLFSSAAEQAGGEFHVVVPRWVDGMGAGRETVAKAAEAIGVRVAHVWEV